MKVVKNYLSKLSCAASRTKHAVALLGMTAAAKAHAAGGWMTAITNITSLAQAAAVAVTAAGFLAGLVAYFYAGKLLWDKGSERGDDIKASRIIFTMIGGTVCFALMYFGILTLETLGGNAADVGRAR